MICELADSASEPEIGLCLDLTLRLTLSDSRGGSR
jgi:hypothetical protein